MFGDTMTGGGDLDGDACADIAIGDADNETASTYAGAVFCFLGPLSGTMSTSDADVTITGTTLSDYLGQSVAFIGAQGGTAGVSDLLVGGYGRDDGGAGAAYTFSASGL